jgi:hypothetical protein
MEKSLLLPTKLLLLGAGALAVAAGPVLFLFPYDTATYFAWVIRHPLTPVFMGASYCGGIGAVWSMRVNRWSLARVQIPGIAVFSITQLLATLFNMDKFNQSHPIFWAWLAVYIVSPVVTILVWSLEERSYQPPTFTTRPLPGITSPVMMILALINGLIGLALFLLPQAFASAPGTPAVWAWTLTPLTAQVIGGWYLAGAALQWMLSRQKSFETAKVALLGIMLVTGLQLTGALLHRAEFNGSPFMIIVYVWNALVLFALSAYTWARATRG